MKIGILSINFHTKGLNFACPVHTYAFQQFLLKNGIESVALDYKANYYHDFEPRHPYDYYVEKYDLLLEKEVQGEEEKRQWEKDLEKMKKKRDGYLDLYKEREIRYDKFQNFIECYCKKTDVCYDSDLLEIVDPGFDCYICATDVVWKRQLKDGFDRGYFLGSRAMENKWKFAYSASRGVPKPYTDEEQKEFFHYLEDIDFISVRENSLKNFIQENSDLRARLVIDPVLLHGRDLYDKVAVKPQDEKYVLVYYAEERSKNTLRYAVNYAKAHQLKIIELTNLPIKGGLVSAYDDVESIFKYDVGPDEWIGYIKHAECVFTNSFHAICFSIIYEKNFFVGSRHGDKIAHLLEQLELSDRMLSDKKEDFKNLNQNSKYVHQEKIDYTLPRIRLEQMRKESGDYILETLHYMEQNERPKKDYEAYKRSVSYPILYNSRKKNSNITWNKKVLSGECVRLKSGSLEFKPKENMIRNDGDGHFAKNGFQMKKYQFIGWNVRLRIDNRWFWYMEDGTLKLKEGYQKERDGLRKIFYAGDAIPYIPVNHIAVVVAEAVWEEKLFDKIYGEIYRRISARLSKPQKEFIKKHIMHRGK